MAASRPLDVVVVGAGVIGSATAHALASSRAGVASHCKRSVVLLEQHRFGHKQGSSHGHSRIIRPVYSQQYYAALMPEAYRRWAALEAEAGATLYTKTGGLYWGPKGFVDDSGDSSDSHRSTCDALGVAYEMLSANEVQERWPPLVATEGWEGLFQPDCGILHADACVAALQAAAAKEGAELHEECVVTGIKGGGEGDKVSVHTADGRTFVADRCIVCAGPWAGELVTSTTGAKLALQPTQQTVAYWPIDKGREAAFEVGQMPVLISDCSLGAFYAIPSALEAERGCWKFDRHGGPVLSHSDLNNKDPSRGAAEVAEIAAYLKEHVRWIGSKPQSVEPCVYTMTRDEDFILDCLPGRPAIVVGAGFSGHGFKLAPVVGRILAQLALGGPDAVDADTRPSLKHWAISRPAVTEPVSDLSEFPYVTQLERSSDSALGVKVE
eukprot:gnl/TRDRNA2_/TRDRNA2_133711_c0_seq1.p1 gnl/TRDRNA2_/TRDRNA2_133711_c0~~gnl/TRDRNA2_/TRDRNA2_133711_c0_seq1.p1  ORF type:complete len:439 (+),score=54.18 gnl/TRDRNA2_/TRDRNA2_133711_c0_seq1:42-1358(+)